MRDVPILRLTAALAAFLSLTQTACAASLRAAHAEEWKVHSIDHDGRGADGVRFADVNGDGLLDLASGWEEQGESRAYLHPGHAYVKKPWPKVTVGKSGSVEDAVFCDLDQDGAVDVVSSSESKAVYVHWAPKEKKAYLDGNAWRTEKLPASEPLRNNWMITVPLQIDGRNGPDLLSAGKDSRVFWFEAPPDARALDKWRAHMISDKGGWTMGLAAVDMDGDGDRDALLGIRTKNPGIKWLENPGPGPDQTKPWAVHEVGPQGTAMGFVAVADLDGDGFLDVVAPVMGAKKLWILRGLGGGGKKWQTIDIPLPKSRNKGAAVGDIDLDGRADVVITHEFGDAAWLSHEGGLASGHWTYHRIAGGGKLDDVTLYDVDGDGDLDVFTTDEKGLQVVWYENPTHNAKVDQHK